MAKRETVLNLRARNRPPIRPARQAASLEKEKNMVDSR
jgi:hypothetical protein